MMDFRIRKFDVMEDAEAFAERTSGTGSLDSKNPSLKEATTEVDLVIALC